MNVIQIIGLIIGIVSCIIIILILKKYRFHKLTENQIIFHRFWLFKPFLKLDNQNIDEIIQYCLMDEIIGYYVSSKDKTYKVPKRIGYDQIRHFAIKNYIRLLKEESWHGGGISVLYEPSENEKK